MTFEEIENYLINAGVYSDYICDYNLIYVEKLLFESGYSESDSLHFIQSFNDSKIDDDFNLFINKEIINPYSNRCELLWKKMILTKSSNINPFLTSEIGDYRDYNISFNPLIFTNENDFVFYSTKHKEKLMEEYHSYCFNENTYNNKLDLLYINDETLVFLNDINNARLYAERKDGFIICSSKLLESVKTHPHLKILSLSDEKNRLIAFHSFFKALSAHKESKPLLYHFFIECFYLYYYEKEQIDFLYQALINTPEKKELFNMSFKDSNSLLWKIKRFMELRILKDNERDMLNHREIQDYNKLRYDFTTDTLPEYFNEINDFLSVFDEEITKEMFVINSLKTKEIIKSIQSNCFCHFNFNLIHEVV